MSTATAQKNALNDATLAIAKGEEVVTEEVTFDSVSRDYRNAKRGLEKAHDRVKEADENLTAAKEAVEETKAAVRKFMDAE